MSPIIALTNARLVDGIGFAPIEPATVLMRDDRLLAAGPAVEIPLPADCQIIDVTGHSVLPGLIDGHQHVSREPGKLDHMGHVQANLEGAGKLQECLRWGTTTVVHAAGSPESILLRDAIREGKLHGCADLVVGAVITPTCGHVRGRSADGPWEIRKAVREMIAAGADHIKTSASGGFQHAHEKLTHEDYSLEELVALVEQVHSREKRVHVHAHAQPGLGNAVAAGCDVILHGVLPDEAAFEQMAEKGLWFMPTLNVTSERFLTGRGLPAYMYDRMTAAAPLHRAGVARAYIQGVKLAVGTDGVPGSVMNELVELVGCGLTPLEALTVGTRNTADALGLLASIGTLKPGKRAHVLVVRGDPTRDITLLLDQAHIALVFKDGQLVPTGVAVALPGSLEA